MDEEATRKWLDVEVEHLRDRPALTIHGLNLRGGYSDYVPGRFDVHYVMMYPDSKGVNGYSDTIRDLLLAGF